MICPSADTLMFYFIGMYIKGTGSWVCLFFRHSPKKEIWHHRSSYKYVTYSITFIDVKFDILIQNVYKKIELICVR